LRALSVLFRKILAASVSYIPCSTQAFPRNEIFPDCGVPVPSAPLLQMETATSGTKQRFQTGGFHISFAVDTRQNRR